MSARLLGAKQRFNKERIQLVENVQSARCSPFVISKVLAARMRKLITARARKNKSTARMLVNARKDHSIPLYPFQDDEYNHHDSMQAHIIEEIEHSAVQIDKMNKHDGK